MKYQGFTSNGIPTYIIKDIKVISEGKQPLKKYLCILYKKNPVFDRKMEKANR